MKTLRGISRNIGKIERVWAGNTNLYSIFSRLGFGRSELLKKKHWMKAVDDNWMAFREYRFEEKKTDLRRRNQNVVSLWKLFLGNFLSRFLSSFKTFEVPKI
jgi:hypothetical protein